MRVAFKFTNGRKIICVYVCVCVDILKEIKENFR